MPEEARGSQSVVIGITVEFRGATRDMIVDLPTGATVESLASALGREIDYAPAHIAIEVARTGTRLPPEAAAAECDLRSGDLVCLRAATATTFTQPAQSSLEVSLKRGRTDGEPNEPVQVRLRGSAHAGSAGGPIRVRSESGTVRLDRGQYTIGSGRVADVRIDDDGLPDVAFELLADADSIYARRGPGVGSVSVDGTVLEREWLRLGEAAQVRAGGARLWIGFDPKEVPEPRAGWRRVVERPRERTRVELGATGEVMFNRPPRRSSLWRPTLIELPSPPAPMRRLRLPLVAALVPLIAGLALFLITKSAMMLAFMGLSPLMVGGSYFADRRSGRKDHAGAIQRFEANLASAGASLYEAVKVEIVERHAQAPQLAAIARWADGDHDRLWERRPWDSDFMALPLGWGRLPALTRAKVTDSSHSEVADARVAQLVAQYAEIDDVPYVAELGTLATIGFSGDRPTSLDAARALVLQATLLHSPSYLGISAALPRGSEGAWQWLKWLPHVRTGAALLQGSALGTGSQATDILRGISRLQHRRLDERVAGSTHGRGAPSTTLLLIIDEELQVDRALVADVLSGARETGVAVIWIGSDPRGLPGQCAITVDTAHDRSARVVEIESGFDRAPIRIDVADASVGATVARTMAPIRDASSADASAAIPTRVRLLEQLRLDSPSGQLLAERWQASRGGLGAVIGAGAGEPIKIDLRADGPHTLIAGTTGAGKSELLRTVVASLAAEHPPTRLTFLLIDYKGGAAFAPCLALPHVLDVVSDLDAELGERALASLDAEMKRRERLLADQRADNLIDLERRAPELAPPNLVIMVDEFAKLREEIPEFIDGVVDVAQRGRTLGIHMVLAAQSLRTAFTPAVRANTNLRIALRVTSEAESQDVLDAPDAARIPSGEIARGRAFARIGHERLVEFQASHVSGRYHDPTAAEANVRPFSFDAVLAPAARRTIREGTPPGADETDLAALARAAVDASRLLDLEVPRPAWAPPLARELSRTAIQRYTSTAEGRCAIGVVDEPEHQTQRPLVLELDRGHVAIFGFSGAGKTTALQTIAAALAWDAAPVSIQIYGIDAASGALSVLEPLPHVGAVVSVTDAERVDRLLARLDREARSRAQAFAAVGASTLTEYAGKAGDGKVPPRVILLVDGFGEFASTYDDARPGSPFDRLMSLLSGGRTAGIHVVLTADRRNAVRSNVAANVFQRIILQSATADDLIAFGIPPRLADTVVLSPGRGFTGDWRLAQIALPAPCAIDDTARGFKALAAHLEEVWPGQFAPAIEPLPESLGLEQLAAPTTLTQLPIAIGGSELAAFTLDLSERNALVCGPYRSGRSNALCVIAEQAARVGALAEIHVLAPRKGPFVEGGRFSSYARGAAECARAALALAARVDQLEELAVPRILVVIDDAGELQDAASWQALERLVRLGRDRGVRVVAAAETAVARMITNAWLRELRKDGQGLILMPESQADGDVLNIVIPRRQNVSMVPGRGYLASRGTAVLVQVPVTGVTATVGRR